MFLSSWTSSYLKWKWKKAIYRDYQGPLLPVSCTEPPWGIDEQGRSRRAFSIQGQKLQRHENFITIHATKHCVYLQTIWESIREMFGQIYCSVVLDWYSWAKRLQMVANIVGSYEIFVAHKSYSLCENDRTMVIQLVHTPEKVYRRGIRRTALMESLQSLYFPSVLRSISSSA